jgi:hypothetical protein
MKAQPENTWLNRIMIPLIRPCSVQTLASLYGPLPVILLHFVG